MPFTLVEEVPTCVPIGPRDALPLMSRLRLCHMIYGISATKSAVVIAETKGTGDKFVVTSI